MQIRFGDDVRRVFIATDGIDFAKLAALLRSKFQCQDDVLIIKYVDDEGDLVTVTDDDELKMALLIAAEMEGPFRLELMGQAAEPTVTPKEEEEPAPDAGGFDFGAGCGQDVQHSFGGGRHCHRGRGRCAARTRAARRGRCAPRRAGSHLQSELTNKVVN